MTKLQQLIKELCPNGVEQKTLGEICQIVRGASPRPIKSYITSKENGVPWIKIGDVSTGAKYVTSTEEYITEEGAQKSRKVYKGDFILSNSMSFGRPYILQIDGCIHDGWLSISGFQELLLPDFLYYVLSSSLIQREMAKKASFGGAVQNLNADIVRGIAIPVPPLPVQEEIVRILDELTEKTEKLILKLNAELEERKKQHEHYQLLLLGHERNSVYPKKNIPEIAETFIGLVTTMTKHYVDNGVLLIHNSDIKKGFFSFKKPTYLNVDFANKNSNRMHKKDDVITVHTGDVGTSAIIDNKLEGSLGFATIVSRIHNKSEVLPQWLCHYLNSSICKQQISTLIKGDRNNLNLKDFNKIYIYIPPIAEQISIIDQLDKIEETYNSIIKNIEEEKDLRQKQYEYYRDKLLTF